MSEEDYLGRIESSLQEQGYPDWLFDDFCKIKDNKMIRTLLKRAYTETAERDYKNRHGIVHGLATTYNSIRLFELLNRDLIKSDYTEIIGLSKEEVLFVLMTAGYVHDTGRFYDDAVENHEEYVNDAIVILEKILQLGEILSELGRIKTDEMMKRVKELCLCHDKKLETSGKVEIAIMKLADALDTGPHRIYTAEDKPELDTDEETMLMKIFEKDEHPGRYFGPQSVENINYEYDHKSQLLRVTFRVKDLACAEEIKKVINILKLCAGNGHRHVRELAGKVHIYIDLPKEKKRVSYKLFPSKGVLARIQSEAAYLPFARLPSVEYEFDIVNLNGDTNIRLPLKIKNISSKKGIDGQTAILGGDFPSKWEEIGIKWFEETASGTRKLPPPKHLRSEEGGIKHVYRINFGRELDGEETIALLGRCHWKHFAKVMESNMIHTVVTPTDLLKMNIKFPEEVTKYKVSAYLEVRNIDGNIVLQTPIEPKKVGDRVMLTLEITALLPQHTYELRWKFES